MSEDSKAYGRTILKRPLGVIAAIAGQFLIAAYLVNTTVFFLRNGAGLSVVLDPVLLLGVITAVALLRKGDWGWWLALITDLLWVAVLLYWDMRMGWAVLWHTGVAAMVPVTVLALLLLPSVKNFYLQSTNIYPIRINPR